MRATAEPLAVAALGRPAPSERFASNRGRAIQLVDVASNAEAAAAATWFATRWFYAVDPATAATTFLSAGPHRDATGMALPAVPEPGTLALVLAGLVLFSAGRSQGSSRPT